MEKLVGTYSTVGNLGSILTIDKGERENEFIFTYVVDIIKQRVFSRIVEFDEAKRQIFGEKLLITYKPNYSSISVWESPNGIIYVENSKEYNSPVILEKLNS